jgi:hypothetical protein
MLYTPTVEIRLNPTTYLSKSKVIPVLLTKNHAMKAYLGVDVQFHSFFDLGTGWR